MASLEQLLEQLLAFVTSLLVIFLGKDFTPPNDGKGARGGRQPPSGSGGDGPAGGGARRKAPEPKVRVCPQVVCVLCECTTAAVCARFSKT